MAHFQLHMTYYPVEFWIYSQQYSSICKAESYKQQQQQQKQIFCKKTPRSKKWVHYIISLLNTHFANYYFLQSLSYYTTILVASVRDRNRKRKLLFFIRLNGKLFKKDYPVLYQYNKKWKNKIPGKRSYVFGSNYKSIVKILYTW